MAAGRSRPHRVSLPPAAGLLRPATPGPAGEIGRQASGRAAHSGKISVYLSARELAGLERARLALRACGVTVDRGRLARKAMAALLADLPLKGGAGLAARRPGSAAGPDPAGRP